MWDSRPVGRSSVCGLELDIPEFVVVHALCDGTKYYKYNIGNLNIFIDDLGLLVIFDLLSLSRVEKRTPVPPHPPLPSEVPLSH